MGVLDNRLTRDDYARVDDRLTERIGDLTRQLTPNRYQPEAWEWVRLAHHAIGCTATDLREVELNLIDRQVQAICDHYRKEPSQ